MDELFNPVIQNYERGIQFFINSKRYQPFITQMQKYGIKQEHLVSISLSCSAHGSFQKQAVAIRFLNHLAQILKFSPKLKKIKLNISGFDLNQNIPHNDLKFKSNGNSTLIKMMVDLINQKISQLTSLQIRVSNIKNCSVQDFKAILNLGVNLEAKQLTNLSCQFSDWTFSIKRQDISLDNNIYNKGIKKTTHDRNQQPSFQTFFNMLNEAFQNTLGGPMQDLKKFRLQISTWYYSDFQAELFLHGSQKMLQNQPLPKNDKIPPVIQHFHNEFKTRVEMMIKNIMPNLTNMEIDLRNWNRGFEMGILKSALLNINNREKQNSLSQISRRQQKTRVIGKSILSMALRQQNNGKEVSQILKQMQQQEQEDIQECFDLNVVV